MATIMSVLATIRTLLPVLVLLLGGVHAALATATAGGWVEPLLLKSVLAAFETMIGAAGLTHQAAAFMAKPGPTK